MSEEQFGYAQPAGESEVFLNFQQALSRAATVNRSVLVVGERGSGKEIAATRLHYLSSRWQHNLVTVNCAALPPSLIETELFGYEAGAFTGATKTRKGRFEEAEGGTLFLDEIGLIPLEVQEKILRVVEYGTYERVGSSKTHESDVRIVGATNADLPTLCAQGSSRRISRPALLRGALSCPRFVSGARLSFFWRSFSRRKWRWSAAGPTCPCITERIKSRLLAYPWRATCVS
jgi:psp operon transcriptional activator